MTNWMPAEIVVHEKVKADPATCYFLEQCEGVPVVYTSNGKSETIKGRSDILRSAKETGGILPQIMAGKQVVYIGPPGNDIVDTFAIKSTGMLCPHFERLKLAFNGCFYQCEWCYLKLTYRAAWPYIVVKVQYDEIKQKLARKIRKMKGPIMFNTGELADSLALEHLTGAAQTFIPWFAEQNAYMFLLTKSANVDNILDLNHNGHTIVCWSMNNAEVSRKFEIGAPSFAKRLEAARKVQDAGYPVRIRLDPIVPIDGWKEAYAETIGKIFSVIQPERITLGTVRFEEKFYTLRQSLIHPGSDLLPIMEGMIHMFAGEDEKGKYTFTEDMRIDLFRFAIKEIRKYSICPIALCKESLSVWNALGMDVSQCRCVCQLDMADMSSK